MRYSLIITFAATTIMSANPINATDSWSHMDRGLLQSRRKVQHLPPVHAHESRMRREEASRDAHRAFGPPGAIKHNRKRRGDNFIEKTSISID